MATPGTISITPGVGQLLDAVTLTVGGNPVVRETLVIADPTAASNLAAVTAAGALKVDGSAVNTPVTQVTSPWVVSGTITANIGTTGGLALDATLTGGTQKSLIYDGTNTIFTSAHPGFIQGSITASVTQTTSPWIVAGGGTAGTAATGVVTIQGIASMTPVQVSQATAANLNATVVGTGTFAVQATLSAETTKVIGTVRIVGNIGGVLDTTLGSAKPANALQVGGNDGTNIYAIPLASGGGSVIVSQATAANLNATVVGTGTFAVQATLSAETTKVIGTVRVIGNGGATLDSTVGAGTAPTNQIVVGAIYNSTEISPTTGQAFALQADSKGRIRQVIMDAAGNTRGANVDSNNNLGVVLPAETTKVIGTIRIVGNVGGVMDTTLGSAKPANALQVGGNDGTNIYAIPLASGGGSVVVSQATAANLNATVKVTDGTNTAAVKAASTAATATDPALVVTTNGSTTAGACANTAVSGSSSAILAANTARREAMIVNTDTVAVYIGLGQTPTATAYHVVLKPCSVAHDGTGGSFVTDVWKGAINAIVASGTGHVAVTELT